MTSLAYRQIPKSKWRVTRNHVRAAPSTAVGHVKNISRRHQFAEVAAAFLGVLKFHHCNEIVPRYLHLQHSPEYLGDAISTLEHDGLESVVQATPSIFKGITGEASWGLSGQGDCSRRTGRKLQAHAAHDTRLLRILCLSTERLAIHVLDEIGIQCLAIGNFANRLEEGCSAICAITKIRNDDGLATLSIDLKATPRLAVQFAANGPQARLRQGSSGGERKGSNGGCNESAANESVHCVVHS